MFTFRLIQKNVAETTTMNGLLGSLFLIDSSLIIQISCSGVRSDAELRGVIPNSFDHIFTHISRTHDQQFLIRASYLEIYQVISFNHFHYLFPIIFIARFFPSQLAITCSKLTTETFKRVKYVQS